MAICKTRIAVGAAVFGLGLWPGLAFAHAAEQGFALLLPTHIYIPAGVAVFVVTVAVLALLPARVGARLMTPRRLWQVPGPDWPVMASSLIAMVALFALVAIGHRGPGDPLSNLLPLMIWSSWWIGFVMLHMLVGDLWRWIDPWAGLYRVVVGPVDRPLLRMPGWVGVWPAIVLYMALAGFTIVDPAPADPGRLAQIVTGYWLFTFAGMVVFGARAWAAHVECLGLLFRILSTTSPLRLGANGVIGFPGWAALRSPLRSTSVAVFCLVILGMGSFDGLHETFWWLALIGVNPLDFPGRSAVTREVITGILVANALLVAVFAGCAWAGCRLAQRADTGAPVPPTRAVFQALALSTVPIGLGFHVAHYLSTFLVWGQYTLAALSDPLASGADLLGLGPVRVLVGFLADAQTVHALWLVQATIIVVSHVVAVVIAQAMTRQILATRRQAAWAEAPLSLFLVGYTVFGLWLLAAARGG